MARWTTMAAAALVTALLVGAGGAAQALDGYPTGNAVGVDISYPSCHTKIPAGTPFGVVGVSGGRVFEDNACAKAEAAKFGSNASFYVNTGLYTGGNYFAAARQEATAAGCATDLCAATQYGKDAADEAYQYAFSQGLTSTVTTWWLDVETTNTWDKPNLDTAEIVAEHDELKAVLPVGTVVGVYAVPSQWAAIVGSTWDPADSWDVWYANGLRNLTATTARQYCTPAQPLITGGPVVLVQWVASKIDQDLAC